MGNHSSPKHPSLSPFSLTTHTIPNLPHNLHLPILDISQSLALGPHLLHFPILLHTDIDLVGFLAGGGDIDAGFGEGLAEDDAEAVGGFAVASALAVLDTYFIGHSYIYI